MLTSLNKGRGYGSTGIRVHADAMSRQRGIPALSGNSLYGLEFRS